MAVAVMFSRSEIVRGTTAQFTAVLKPNPTPGWWEEMIRLMKRRPANRLESWSFAPAVMKGLVEVECPDGDVKQCQKSLRDWIAGANQAAGG